MPEMAGHTKFTPENRAVIIAQVRVGGTLESAGRELGIRLKTIQGWLTRGRRERDGDYTDFAQAIEEARLARQRAGMDEDEFDRHLAKAVRAGSVQAMRLWADLHIKGKVKDDAAEPADPFEELEAAGNVTPIRRG